jgi:hypothetical protein
MDKQRAEHPGMPCFIAPDDIPTMLQPSQRTARLNVHLSSLACAADSEEDFRNFVRLMKVRRAALHSKEDGLTGKSHPEDYLVKLWRKARRNGAAKAGGEENAKRAEIDFWAKFAVIKDRWHLLDVSAELLKEAGIRHHDTVRSYLTYTRWEWRRLTDAKRQRLLEKHHGKQ